MIWVVVLGIIFVYIAKLVFIVQLITHLMGGWRNKSSYTQILEAAFLVDAAFALLLLVYWMIQ